MYVDLWQWIYDYASRVSLQVDGKGVQLALAVHDGLQYRQDADADNALRRLEDGVKLAQELNEPCWVMFCKHWITDIHFYFKHNYQLALDNIIRLATESRKEIYEDCPIRSAVFFLLADIYCTIDFYGYENKIVDLLNYIETEIQMDEDTHLRVLHMRNRIDFEYKDYGSAEKRINNILKRSLEQHPYRQYSSYDLLRRIAYARNDISLALKYNGIAQNYVEEVQMQLLIAEGKLWQAVCLQRIGETQKAEENYTTALAKYEHYNLSKEVVFYSASAEYMELIGNIEQAIELRLALVEQVMASASIYNQMHANLSYCRILGRSGKSMDTAMITARSVADNSLNPQVYLQKLDEIQAGNYWEYAWQKDNA